jgi:aldehyde:ferredoxin oxidoreductase
VIQGYNQRGLRIDLSSGKIEDFPLSDDILTSYLGGRGLGVYFHHQETQPTIDPFSSDSLLVIAAGGLGGSVAPTSGRFSIIFKSPLTGTIFSSNSGGFWGNVFKRTGYDILLIKGKAAVPVYLYLSEQKVRIIECPELWGSSIPELSRRLQARHSSRARILGIGPAGENLVRLASIMNDLSRTAGRGGGGAVMGAKNLKAIVVEGRKTFPPANREKYQTGLAQSNKLIRSMPVTAKAFPLLGTAGLLKLVYQHDMLVHRNFQDTIHHPDNIEKISGETLRRTIFRAPQGCFNCRIRCARLTQVNHLQGEGPEFETIAMLGANLDIYDLPTIARANYLCNDYGLDTISLGNTIGAAMELWEKGYLSLQETGGRELRFGASGLLEEVVRLTAFREEIGHQLAEGSQRLCEKYQAPELAMVVKGLELPAYDPRSTLMQALGYATSTRGGCHLKGGYMITLGFFGGPREVGRFLVETVADHVVDEQDSGCVADMLGICRFAYFAFSENELSRIYSGFTGIDIGPHDLKRLAKKVIDEERSFNLKAGIKIEADTLPTRFFTEKITIAGQKRLIERSTQFEYMLKKYYEIRKWRKQTGEREEKNPLKRK